MSSVGQPLPRVDGRRKVTGAAQYTGDVPFRGALHGAIVHSTIANGRTISIDTSAAEGAPGVVAVFTYRNMPRMKPVPKPWSHLQPYGQGYLPLQDDRIHYAGQPLALVLANTPDEAAYAGTLVKVEYEARPPAVFNAETANHAVDPPQFLWPVSSSVGDVAKGFADGIVKIERVYRTSDRHHNQMEPHVTLAARDASGRLTLFDTTQHIFGTRELLSIVLVIPRDKIEVVSLFLGGGYGGKA